MTDRPVVASFFSGCGGLDLGFEQLDYDIAISNDNWSKAADTYSTNFENTAFLKADVRELTTEHIQAELHKAGYETSDIDVVVGGPPCQGFSRLNNEEIALDSMEKDQRNTLFEEFLRVVGILNPRFVVMENVQDLINRKTSDGRYVKDQIVSEFNQYGYHCDYDVLTAHEFGVPQKRRRIFFIGAREDQPVRFPTPTHRKEFVSAGEALSGVTDSLPNMTYPNTDSDTLEKIRHIPPGGYYRDLPDRLKTKKYQCDCEDTEKCSHEPKIVKRYGTYLRRLDPDEPSLTVSNNPFIHPTKDRFITPREKARLQTFPDDFEFQGNKTEVVKQIANAVPVKLSRQIAEALLKVLPHDESQLDTHTEPVVNDDTPETSNPLAW